MNGIDLMGPSQTKYLVAFLPPILSAIIANMKRSIRFILSAYSILQSQRVFGNHSSFCIWFGFNI